MNCKMVEPYSEIAIINQKKYLKSPTWEDMKKFMDLIGVYNHSRIEKFYGMPHSTFSNIKCGQRKLPCQYWHIIYDKVEPSYGVGFVNDYAEKIVRGKKVKKDEVKVRQLNPKKNVVNLEVHHSRLAKLR